MSEVSVTVTVPASAPPPEANPLPTTGAPVELLVALAAALILTGLGVLRRSRTPARPARARPPASEERP